MKQGTRSTTTPIESTFPAEVWSCSGCGEERLFPGDYCGLIRLPDRELRLCWCCIVKAHEDAYHGPEGRAGDEAWDEA